MILRCFPVMLAGLGASVAAFGADPGPTLLTRVAEVVALPAARARDHLPVHLGGVVTFAWHQGTTEFTLQDDTGAVWVPPVQLPPNCVVGSRIALDGRTEAGAMGTIVLADGIRVLGPGVLPPAQSATYEDLFSNRLHMRRVELTGVVRSQRVNPEAGLGWLALEVMSDGRRMSVHVTHEIIGHPELIDARVRIRGVNLRALGQHQDGFLPYFSAHTLDDLTVIDAPAKEPFAGPPVALDRVLRDSTAGGFGRRLHVQGVVSFVRPDRSFLLQDATRGLQVILQAPTLPVVGEAVDVIGFPEPGTFSPVLCDADWRPGPARPALEPLSCTMDEALRQDGRLLRLDGRITAHSRDRNERSMTVHHGGDAFRLVLPEGGEAEIPIGAEIAAVGVCRVEALDWESQVIHRQPGGFALLARSAGDITILRPAPFLTARNLGILLGAAGLVLAVLQGAIWFRSRRRIRELSRSRNEAQAQFTAILRERTRMAREIHDTLAQGFTAISAQLEVINDQSAGLSAPVRRHLDLARELVRESLEESRRSVWNLRAQTLEDNGLPGTLARLGEQLTDGGRIAFRFTMEGGVRLLTPMVENNLLRIAQEALTNAVRHGNPRHLTCTLSFSADAVSLAIEDDGAGFDPAQVTHSEQGGFGLSGIRERAKDLAADLSITSTPGRGTHLRLTIPHV